jgi:antitoxin CcdA
MPEATESIKVRAAIVEEARALKVDLHHAAEAGLAQAIRQAKWALENAEVIESTNAYVDRHGLPLRRYRSF